MIGNRVFADPHALPDWQVLDGERVRFLGDSVARIKESGSGDYELAVYRDGRILAT